MARLLLLGPVLLLLTLASASPGSADVTPSEYSMSAEVPLGQIPLNTTFPVLFRVQYDFAPPSCVDVFGSPFYPPPDGCYAGIAWIAEYDETLLRRSEGGGLCGSLRTCRIGVHPDAPLPYCILARDTGSRWSLGCVDIAGATMRYSGPVYVLQAECIAPGVSQLDLSPEGTGGTVVDNLIGPQPIHTHEPIVSCGITSPDADGDQLPDAYEGSHSCLAVDVADGSMDVEADGLSALEEFVAKTDPCALDSDMDGLRDGSEWPSVCFDPLVANSLGDADRDGVHDVDEQGRSDACSSNPDFDSMPDAYEVPRACLLPLVADNTADPDGDFLDNVEERNLTTEPCQSDTDGDGMSDGYEAQAGCVSPLITEPGDTDFDDLSNSDEFAIGTNVCVADTDEDGCIDGGEVRDDPALGGRRNPLDPFDFYDVVVDRFINMQDALALLSVFGAQPGGGNYLARNDRQLGDPATPWATIAAHDGIDLIDVLANLRSFGHACVP